MREHDPNFRSPVLPGVGWRLIAGGHEPQPREGVQIFRDRFERVDYMAVVALRELPR